MKQNTRQVLVTAAESTLAQMTVSSVVHAPMGLEPLEDRRLMTASPMAPIHLNSAGVLTMTGNATAGSQLRVEYGNGGNANYLVADVDGQVQAVPASWVKSIHVSTGAGNDSVYIDPRITASARITTGAGNDVVHGGGGHEMIWSGDGEDVIFANGGHNTIHLGTGLDTVSGEQTDRVVGRHQNPHDVRLGGLANPHLYGAGHQRSTSTAGTEGHGKGHTGKLATQPTTTATPVATPVAAPVATPVAASVAAPLAKPVATPVATPIAAPVTTAVTTPTATSTSKGSSTATAVRPAVVEVGGTPAADAAALSAAPKPGGTTADGKPVAVLQLMPGVRQTGLAVNVDGLSSFVGSGSPISTQYSWDFGDAHGAHDQLTGFNAAHVYDVAGTYTVTLSVTNDAGLTSVAQGQVTVAESTRHAIYVDAVHGSDANTGTSTAAPMKTAAAALAKVTNNTDVLLKAGETFGVTTSMVINNANVTMGRYGTGADPVLMRSQGSGSTTVSTWGGADGVTFQHLTFDTPNAVSADGVASKTGLGGIYLRGTNETVRNCTFLNIDNAVDESGNPNGTLVSDNTAPLTTGLRGYMVWVQGNRSTIVGNTVANTTREHCIRLVTASEITVEGNTLANLSRAADGDTGDDSKGCIEMHMGQYAWISNNHVTDGDIRVGPRGAINEAATSSSDSCVIQDNQLTDTFVSIMPGTHHCMVQGNVVTMDAGQGEQAFVLNGSDAVGRVSTDITIRSNTVVDNDTWGNFIRVQNNGTDISLTGNLFIAPQLKIGYQSSAAVYVSGADLSGFKTISNNVWPSRTGSNGTDVNDVTGRGWVSAGQWLAYSQVHGDSLQAVTTKDLNPGTYQLMATNSTAGVTVGAALARAA